jgi:hypothetical protein
MSSSPNPATSAQRSPIRRIRTITARSRRPTGPERSQASSRAWTWAPVSARGSPDSLHDATGGTASTSARSTSASACRKRSSDRNAQAVICADLRGITGNRAARNAATSPALTSPTRLTPAGHNTLAVNGRTQCM